MSKLVALESFPLPNYLKPDSVAYGAHKSACNDGPRWASEAHELKLLADAIYAQAVRCGRDGEKDSLRAGNVY